jgi:hypothetical protein
MVIPVSISAFPVRGYSIAKDVVGVNTLVQSPLVVAGRPLNAWEGYNYKSFPRRLLVVIFPEETIPSWSRGGAPHPASAVMRTTLIESGKRIFMARRSYKHHERRGCSRRPWDVSCYNRQEIKR